MKFASRAPRSPDLDLPGVVGTARVDRRTEALIPRLRPGDIAVIDHPDLDRATAHRLVDAGVAGVVNASPMISGRYASLGAEVLAKAGVSLLDRAGPQVVTAVKDGSRIRLHDGIVHGQDGPVATGASLDAEGVTTQMAQARDGMATHLTSFTHNASEFLLREQDLLLHGRGLPGTRTTFTGRPVVVVVPGHEHRARLAGAKRYIREMHPVLVGVDRGADALLEAGHTPDVVVTGADQSESDPVSRAALKGARDVVVCVSRGSSSAATAALRQLGVHPLILETGATTEDAALVLAHRAGASVIIGVGLHATLEEFLDRQRAALASTYLTRLSVGPTLVDVAALPQLYSGRVRPRHLLGVALAGLLAVGGAVATTPVGQDWVDQARPAVDRVVDGVTP
ncbi:putative cytokinetic ring protein SteA [Nocardioides bigeumensis]|jgi:uncharacterized membrane-anchored protein|uniref:Cytokinetic ring protein SteA n=1 Tax=Nocardioides bigeumensis TaxID=433657 RepID=A0ABN2Y1U3_9ACTN